MINILIILLSFLIIVPLYYFLLGPKKRVIKRSQSDRSINKWMEMSKVERRESWDREKRLTMLRKQNLLNSIRKEYKEVRNTKSKNDRPPFIPNK